jgi:hypothetical protein
MSAKKTLFSESLLIIAEKYDDHALVKLMPKIWANVVSEKLYELLSSQDYPAKWLYDNVKSKGIFFEKIKDDKDINNIVRRAIKIEELITL